jgi:hypothetical protein
MSPLWFRSWLGAGVLAIGWFAGTCRADEPDPDLAPPTKAFLGRVNKLIDQIKEDTKEARNSQPRRANAAALLIALHAKFGEGGGGSKTRATLFRDAILLAETIQRRELASARKSLETLAQRKPDPNARIDLDLLIDQCPDASVWFGAKERGGLGIEGKLLELHQQGLNVQPRDLNENLLDLAHHTAVIADYDLARAPRQEGLQPEWDRLGTDMRTGAYRLAAAVQARDGLTAAKALATIR